MLPRRVALAMDVLVALLISIGCAATTTIAAATAPRPQPSRRTEPPTEPNRGAAGYAMAGAIAAVVAVAGMWVSRRRRRP